MDPNNLHLSSPGNTASLSVACADGGRVSSLVVHGHELLVERASDPLAWGMYPMVPFAGRVRDGLITFAGQSVQLPVTMGAHAIHGYGFVTPWEVVGDGEIRFDFREPWPWRGSATQHFELTDGSLTITMGVDAIDRQPVQVGWHPWFRRDIGTGHTASLDFDPAAMFARDAVGMPSSERIAPTPGPWDDCFTNLASDPRLSWGDISIELSSSADCWTVYDEPAHAMCVEPQTGPPNQVNDDPHIVEAGEAFSATFTIHWTND